MHLEHLSADAVSDTGERLDQPVLDMGVDMCSAFDWLMDDVAGGKTRRQEPTLTETPDELLTTSLGNAQVMYAAHVHAYGACSERLHTFNWTWGCGTFLRLNTELFSECVVSPTTTTTEQYNPRT